MCKLIVIEGSDGSGKQTQSKLLYEYLLKNGKRVKLISFPDYKSDDIKMLHNMLNGEYCGSINDMNVYVSCSLFALDRWNSFIKEWKDFYFDEDSYIICDRYAESMMMYASNRFSTTEEKNNIINYILDLEYNKYNIPVPNKVIYLNRNYKNADKSLQKRDVKNKTGNESVDIIERDSEFISTINSNIEIVKNNSEKFSSSTSWSIIDYAIQGREKTIDEIHNEIKRLIQ